MSFPLKILDIAIVGLFLSQRTGQEEYPSVALIEKTRVIRSVAEVIP